MWYMPGRSGVASRRPYRSPAGAGETFLPASGLAASTGAAWVSLGLGSAGHGQGCLPRGRRGWAQRAVHLGRGRPREGLRSPVHVWLLILKALECFRQSGVGEVMELGVMLSDLFPKKLTLAAVWKMSFLIWQPIFYVRNWLPGDRGSRLQNDIICDRRRGVQPQRTRSYAALALGARLWPCLQGQLLFMSKKLFSSFEPLHAWMPSVWGVHANTVFPG